MYVCMCVWAYSMFNMRDQGQSLGEVVCPQVYCATTILSIFLILGRKDMLCTYIPTHIRIIYVLYVIPLQAPLTLSLPDTDDGDDPSSIANLSFERNMLPKTLGGIKQRPCGKEGRLVVFTAKVRTQAVLDFVSSVSDKVCGGVGECVCVEVSGSVCVWRCRGVCVCGGVRECVCVEVSGSVCVWRCQGVCVWRCRGVCVCGGVRECVCGGVGECVCVEVSGVCVCGGVGECLCVEVSGSVCVWRCQGVCVWRCRGVCVCGGVGECLCVEVLGSVCVWRCQGVCVWSCWGEEGL